MNFAAPLIILETTFGLKVGLIADSLLPKVLINSLSLVEAMRWLPVLRAFAIVVVVVTRQLYDISFLLQTDFKCSLRKLGSQRVIVSIAIIEEL
jgi:hypothetical protein